MTDNFILKNVKIKDSKEPCDIFVSEGIIKRIGKNISEENTEVFDCTGLNVINGLFDMHVHFRDPGFTHKEDIITGTRFRTCRRCNGRTLYA